MQVLSFYGILIKQQSAWEELVPSNLKVLHMASSKAVTTGMQTALDYFLLHLD